jgi:hypothetical protein
MKQTEMIEIAHGDVRAWVEQEAVHLKAADQYGDPVELNAEELKSLIDELSRLYEIVKRNG